MIRVKDWSSYQSYKDRKPPWIRFHKSMLDNYEFHMMSVTSRALLPMFWLIASEDENPVSGLIRDSYEKIAFRLRVTAKEVTDTVAECEKSGFLEILESDNNKETQERNQSVHAPLRERNPDVTPETETETETETEKSKYIGNFENFWNVYGKIGNKKQAEKAYKKTIKEGIKHETIIRGVEQYQNHCRAINQERKYIKHGSTWLDNRCWEDEYPTSGGKPAKTSIHENITSGIALALSEISGEQ